MSNIASENRHINAVFEKVLTLVSCSSLSSGTIVELVEGGFLPSTNISQTISNITCVNYKAPKLYMGCKAGGKPDLSRQWFVYYSYRNPSTGKFERQPPIYRDINTFDSIGERKEYGRAIILVYKELLKAGFSPYEEFVSRADGSLNKNILNCAALYLSEKEKALTPKGFSPYKQHVGWFVDWIKRNRMEHMNIDQFKRSHITQFLSDYRILSEKEAKNPNSRKRKPAGNRQINNIKDNVGLFFNYFKTNFEDDLKKNPAKGIKKLRFLTQGNKAYTDKQAEVLKDLMKEHNPKILFFCEFIYESCTRPHEEARLLKVSDVEFDQNRIHIRPELSKAGRSEYIPMAKKYMDKLKDYIAGYSEDDFLFAVNGHPGKKGYNPMTPGPKPVSEWSLTEWYKKIKRMVGLDETWGIYSWKHTYCVRAYLATKDIYFIQQKCRHSTLVVTCNYLRSLGLFVDLNMIADQVRGL